MNLADEAGAADATTTHTTLMPLLDSTWIAATTTAWTQALPEGTLLTGDDLGSSAIAGGQAARARPPPPGDRGPPRWVRSTATGSRDPCTGRSGTVRGRIDRGGRVHP